MNYEFLEENTRKEAVQAALLALERLLFDCDINMAANGPNELIQQGDEVIRIEDKRKLVELQLLKLREAFPEYRKSV